MTEKKENVTIKDVARQAGVSVATVSQVVNGNGHASEETKNKILRIIEETGYVPNSNARSLRKKQDDAVAILLPDISNEFYARMVQGIQDTLFSLGRNCVIFNTRYNEDIEKQSIELICAQHIKAVIAINCIQMDICKLPSDCCAVYIDSCPVTEKSNERYVYFSADHEHGAYLATEKLIQKGCRDLLMITCKTGEPATEQRRKGFNRACKDYQIENTLCYEAKPRDYNDAAQKIVQRLLKKGTHFDGVFAQNDIIATGVLTQLLQAGIRVPDQVKIVGFDDISFAQYAVLPLTTVHQPIWEMGSDAAKTVVELLEKGNEGRQNRVFPISLVIRQTT
ncbi:MAG: LacI family DNA-binding transcriptional regulator [Oscillospiraceae bacterium]|nr:LacI family DNA-binding transcriptional regulator [Oscillospiraceae bacterium]